MPKPKKSRRPRGDGALYQRTSDGMWIGAVSYRVGERKKRATVSAKTQKTARIRLERLKAEIAEAGQAADRQTSVADWLRYWLDEIAAPSVRPSTLRGYRASVEAHLIPALGPTRLARLAPEHVRAMHREVMAKTWRGKPLTSTTAMHAHRALATALEAARRDGKVVRNVAELVTPPGRSGNERGALTADQARTLLAATAADRMSSRWMMALLTGARQGECLGLRWAHVHLDERVLDLAWQLQRIDYRHGCGDKVGDDWPCGRTRAGSCPDRTLGMPRDYEHTQLAGGMCLVRPKSAGSIRVVPIAPPLLASLRVRHEAYETERQRYASDHDLVWPREDGAPMAAKADTAAWRAACRRAGVPAVDLHAARHTTATLLLEAGVDNRIVQEIVGHSSVAMTHGYQHVDLALRRRALDALVDRLELPSG